MLVLGADTRLGNRVRAQPLILPRLQPGVRGLIHFG